MRNIETKTAALGYASVVGFASLFSKSPWWICHRPKRMAAWFIFCFGVSLGQPAYADIVQAENIRRADVFFEDVSPSSTNGLGYWIWDRVTRDKQTVRLWKSFEIPEGKTAIQARLQIAGDNAFKLWLDGCEIGSGSDWNILRVYDFTGHLKSGTHVLAVEGVNYSMAAGVIAGLQLKLDDGQALQFRSDASWRVAPSSQSGWEKTIRPSAGWPKATIVGPSGKPALPMLIGHTRMFFPGTIPFWQTGSFQFLLSVACVAFVSISLYLLIQLVSQAKAHNLLQAERDRIARDIHDDLGSKVTQLLLIGEVAQIPGAKDDPVPSMCESARSILNSIDEVVWIVNSQRDTLDEFAIYICKFTQSFLGLTSVRCRFDIEHDLPKKQLNHLTRRNLFLAVKESLNNVAKHSKATELVVRIKMEGAMFVVVLEDNGRGFKHQPSNVERHGLYNMNMRMREVGGYCRIASQPQQGCRVTFDAPLKRNS